MAEEGRGKKIVGRSALPESIVGIFSGLVLALLINLLSGFRPSKLYILSLITTLLSASILIYFALQKAEIDRRAWVIKVIEEEKEKEVTSFNRWIEINENLYKEKAKKLRIAWWSILALFIISTFLTIRANSELSKEEEKSQKEIIRILNKLEKSNYKGK